MLTLLEVHLLSLFLGPLNFKFCFLIFVYLRTILSADWRFGIAYNAALKLCLILLYSEGYEAERNLQHYRTIQALPKILGSEKNDDTVYLDTCRAKRNTAEYDSVGVATDRDSDELIDFVKSFREEVLEYLRIKHPGLLGIR